MGLVWEVYLLLLTEPNYYIVCVGDGECFRLTMGIMLSSESSTEDDFSVVSLLRGSAAKEHICNNVSTIYS